MAPRENAAVIVLWFVFNIILVVRAPLGVGAAVGMQRRLFVPDLGCLRRKINGWGSQRRCRGAS